MAVDRTPKVIELPALYFEDLAVGQSASLVCTVDSTSIPTLDAIDEFADGDDADLQDMLDGTDFYTDRLQFGQDILHGIFTSGLVARLIGTRLPGIGGVYLSQTFQYIAPVRVGDTITARVEIVELVYSRRRVRLFCECLRDGMPVLEGEAWIGMLARADSHDADAAR